MKFLIIGASGFIGRHLCTLLRSQGYAVLGTASQARPQNGLIGLELAQERLLDKIAPSFFSSGGPVFVVIAASISKIDTCRREPLLTQKINLTNTIRLIEDAAAQQARLVLLSSSAVFDGQTGYYTEEDPAAPLSEYGRQKAKIEAYCRQHHPTSLLLRLDKIVGDDPAENHLFSEWLHSCQMGQPLLCMANQIFSPTLVNDVARAIILGCAQGLTGLYHVANGEYFSRDELARQFLRILGRSADVVCKTQQELGFTDRRPEKSYLDASRFREASGMSFTSMRQTLTQFKAKIG